jgi:hypothetical protein
VVNRPRDKGTAAETAVVDYLQSYGFHVERRALHGATDRGDIAGLHAGGVWVCEVKAVAQPSYGAWLKEAETERRNADADYGVVLHKPRGVAQPARYRAVMDLHTFTRVLRALGETT